MVWMFANRRYLFPWIDILHINWPTRAHLSHLEALTLEQPPRVGVDLYSFSVGVELIQYIWRIRMLKHERYRTEHFTLALCISIYCINSGGWCGYKFVQFHCCLPLAVYLSISHKLKYIYIYLSTWFAYARHAFQNNQTTGKESVAHRHTQRDVDWAMQSSAMQRDQIEQLNLDSTNDVNAFEVFIIIIVINMKTVAIVIAFHKIG